ncbi:MAG: hypothetical protein R3E10_08535 [Gemmatimonadota bacterium]
MKRRWVRSAGLLAAVLPLTASSASAQARVEVDEWWETKAALEGAADRLGPLNGDDFEIVDDFATDARARTGVRGEAPVLSGDAYDRREDRYEGRDGYVDARGRIDIGVGSGGWGARVVVVRDRDRRDYAYRPLWRTVRWDARFDVRRLGRFYDDRLDRGELRRLLGRGTVDRLERHADRIGARGRLVGRWVPYARGGRVLQVRAGGTPVAELVAYGRDPWVDVVRLNVRRWYAEYDRYDDYGRDDRPDRRDDRGRRGRGED